MIQKKAAQNWKMPVFAEENQKETLDIITLLFSLFLASFVQLKVKGQCHKIFEQCGVGGTCKELFPVYLVILSRLMLA